MTMKKNNLFVLALVLMGTTAFSQIRFDVGLKGGLNFASVNTGATVAQNYSNRTGYHFGAYAMVKFTKFAIQPEIVFSRQGQTFTTPSASNLEASFDYINIPIILKFYLIGGLNLQAGPQFGFLSSAKGDLINKLNNTQLAGQDLSNFVNSSDVSIGAGLGWDFPFGLNVNARYNIGLSDVNKYTGNTIPGNLTSSLGTSESKNQVFQFSLGYRLIKLGK
jgi:hypothetical protein